MVEFRFAYVSAPILPIRHRVKFDLPISGPDRIGNAMFADHSKRMLGYTQW